MGWKRALVVLLVLNAYACAKQHTDSNELSYEEKILGRPEPTSDQEKKAECGFIRAEIAKTNALLQGCAFMAKDMPNFIACQTVGRNKIATLETRAANISCLAAFSSSQGVPSDIRASFEQCFERCQRLTGQTKERCFEVCK